MMKTVILLALAGCTVSTTTGTSQLSRELVEQSLVKGKTTKARVRRLLSEPQSTTSGDMGLNVPGVPAETWTYSKTFHRDSQEESGLAGSFANYALTGACTIVWGYLC